MTPYVTRREFLKMTGLATGALLLSGCTANLQQAVWMEPYNQAPEQTLPGEDTWFASTCRMCPAGCGIVARISNGRARKIEGNPEHPLNRGRLCARGQAGLQQLYHPDRLRQIMKRTGQRGQGQWGATSWEQIVDEISQHLQGADPARVAFLTGLLPDYQSVLVSRFMKGLGAEPPVISDAQTILDGRVVLEAAGQAMFNDPSLPIFDIGQADVVYAFGANFLETWLSPVAYGHAYGQMRSQSGIRGALVSFEPRLSMTAANADRWVPIAPGYEGLVALALGKIIVDEGLGHDGLTNEYNDFYQNVDVAAIAQAADISLDDLSQLARTFAGAHHPIAMPGGGLAGYSNGLKAVQAVEALNFVLGHTGRHGAMFLTPPAPSRDLRTDAAQPFQAVQDLIGRMAAGEVDTLFILGTNPAYELPSAAGFVEALAQVQQVITFAVLPDETTNLSDIVLPAHTYLETWGYQRANPGAEQLIVSAQQPVVRPLYDTRDPGDALLALANKLGDPVAKRLPWPNLVNFIETRLTSLQLQEGNINAEDIESFWAYWLQHGGWWSKESAWTAPEAASVFSSTPLTVPPPEFEGDSSALHLLPVASVAFGDGRHAALPWLQETPDPMTTASWDTWVELNPVTAQSLGIKDNDVVKITSPHGQIEAIAYLYPGIRPDVVAVPIGQGHTEAGRWAKARGGNILSLLAPHIAAGSGHLAWAATRVQLEKTGQQQVLPVLESKAGVARAHEKGETPG